MITEYFEQKGILHPKPEVSDTRHLYKMEDDGGVELEVGEFLYGLVKVVKPKNILTTGVYTGVSDLYIAQGLKDNGFGKTTAVEYEQFHITRARELWDKAGLSDYIQTILSDSLKYEPKDTYQLMFLDTELHLRYHELVKFYPYLEEGGFVLIHDMPRNLCQGNFNSDHPDYKHWPVGELPFEFLSFVREGKLMPFHFGTPRGLVGYYKPHKDDYGYFGSA